jgi:predicted naringenin-chalcone synthase
MTRRNNAYLPAARPLVQRALAEIEPATLARLGQLVTVSCTHAGSPSLEHLVFELTDAPRTVHRWHLGFMGCSAGLAGLRLVQQTSPAAGPTLVLCCELCSLHFQYSEQLDQITANLLFADAAAAVTLSAEPSPVRLIDARCAHVPEQAEQMLWWAEDHGLRLRLDPALAQTLGEHLPEALAGMLGDHGLSVGDVDHWLIHPGGPKILERAAESLGLAPSALEGSRAVLRACGNMSSATILVILRRLLDAGGSGLCCAIAFGPGLVIEMALMRLEPRP